jgi:hypothetical protein
MEPFAGDALPLDHNPAEDATAPSPRFLQVAADIAYKLGLDPRMLAEGHPVDAHGLRFWFVHFGQRDPEGMTMFVRIGEVQEGRPEALRRLLEFNGLFPVGMGGYYAIMPGTDVLVCGWRWDIESVDDAAERIVAEVSLICRHVADVRHAVDHAVEEVLT